MRFFRSRSVDDLAYKTLVRASFAVACRSPISKEIRAMSARWVLIFISLAVGMFQPGMADAQLERPLSPRAPVGLPTSPFFEGWYANPDGTYTLSFGYFNRNRDEVVEIEIGPDNFIEPARYDGPQPTSFPPFDYGGLSGRRERGVFTITIPAEERESGIVWTLRSNGATFSVPGKATVEAYELSHQPMAMGSVPPLLRFSSDGPPGRGPAGISADPVRAAVGAPVALTVWLHDDSEREQDASINVSWFKHRGPGKIIFDPQKDEIQGRRGSSSTLARFSEPGEYLIRVRGDNFGAIDSMPGDQCCWTNGYVTVIVTH